jgi:hypothetical protein
VNTCKWILEESKWCRQQLKEMGYVMDIKGALKVADLMEDEGVISTCALALRCLAKEYRDAKLELQAIEYERTKHIPQLLKERNGGDLR